MRKILRTRKHVLYKVVKYVLELGSFEGERSRRGLEVLLRVMGDYSEVVSVGISTGYVYLYEPGMYRAPVWMESREVAEGYLRSILVAMEKEMRDQWG